MVSDSVLDYAMEGTDPLEVQNRLLSGIAGKRLYKMQTVSSEAVWAGTVDFDISLKKRGAWVSLYSGDRAGNCNDQRPGAEIRLLE